MGANKKMVSMQYWADAATKNCVWIFQTRRTTNSDAFDSEGDLLHFNYWHSEKVFLTRQEALDYGNENKHNYGEYMEGWNIWGVPCDGLMADLLGKHNEEFKDQVEYITKY
jgi:hypothetical protein